MSIVKPVTSLQEHVIHQRVIHWLMTELAGHINHLYNTTFWALVQKGGLANAEAENALKVCNKYQAFRSKTHRQVSLLTRHDQRVHWQQRSMRFCSVDSVSITTKSRRYSGKDLLSSEKYVFTFLLCIEPGDNEALQQHVKKAPTEPDVNEKKGELCYWHSYP